MLLKLLDEVCAEISSLNVKHSTPLMLREIQRARPDFNAELKQLEMEEGTFQLISSAIAAGLLMQIKEIPTIVHMMLGKADDPRTDPATRCALVGVLAYLVQPHDILPDKAPGGYGYIDDCAILRAGLIEYMNTLPPNPTEAEKQGKYLNSYSSVIPQNLVPALQQALTGVSMAFQILRALPTELLEATTQIAITNPLQASVPQPPSGFTPTAGFAPALDSSGSGGHWSGGAYFEGGNVMMPGGPSLIDGQLFIPD